MFISPPEARRRRKETRTSREGCCRWVYQNRNNKVRGFYLGGLLGDPLAQTEVNQSDMQIHFPDKWKFPSHPTFSQESIYSNSKQDPYWMENLSPYKQGTWGLIHPLRGLLNLEIPQ